MPGTSIARGTNVCVFTQQPYKGDDHTQASLEVARFLASTDMQAKNAKWYGNTIPARQSAQKLAPPEDEQLVRLLDYSKKHVRWTHPYAHPTYAKWEDTVMNAGVEQLVAGKMTPEQLEEELRKGGDNLMKTWLQTEKNKEVIEYWARVPEGYPGPQFPNWKQRTHQEAGY